MKHPVIKSGWHKGYVWLFSKIENNMFTSVHKTEDDENKGRAHYAQLFQEEHDRQIDAFIVQAEREEKEWLAKNGGVIKDPGQQI